MLYTENTLDAGVTQLARVTAFQAVGCEFESRRLLQKITVSAVIFLYVKKSLMQIRNRLLFLHE